MCKKIFAVLALLLTSAMLWAGETYNFMMISDTHFGSEASFGPSPAPKIQKKLKRCDQAVPNFRAMFSHMVKTSDQATKFLIHAGDIIEGYGFNAEAQAGQFFMADTLLKEYIKLPIYMVRGNHEAGGKTGGNEAYFKTIAPAIAKNAGQPADTIHYTVTCGEDLFIFVDGYRNPDKFLRNTLKNLAKRPRYIFLVIHQDVIPQPHQFLLDLIKQLLPYDGIILNGHTHRNRVLKYVRDGHTVTQYTIGSYVIADTAKMRYESTKNDTAAFLKKFRNAKYVATPERKQLFDAEFVPFIQGYQEFNALKGRSTAAGYARIKVSDAGVTVLVQSADLSQKPFEIKLIDKQK